MKKILFSVPYFFLFLLCFSSDLLAQGCACGESSFVGEFKLSSRIMDSGDKAVFTGPDAPVAGPNDREATYSSPAEFVLIGAPRYPIYTVEVTTGEPAPTGGKEMLVSLPCGFEYRFPSESGSTSQSDGSWTKASSVGVLFNDTEGGSKSFEIRITSGDDDGASEDSEEAGAPPQTFSTPETFYPDPVNGTPTDTGERGFAMSFPLGRLSPAGKVEKRESAGALTVSAIDSPTSFLDLSNFKLNRSSSVFDLPEFDSESNVIEYVEEVVSLSPATSRKFLSPSVVLEVSKSGGTVTVLASENNGGNPGALLSTTIYSLGTVADAPPGLEPPLIIQYVSSTSEHQSFQLELAVSSDNKTTSSKIAGERIEETVHQLNQPDCYNQKIVKKFVDLPGGGEECVSMIVSDYCYLGEKKILVSRRSDLDADHTTVEGPMTTWTYYETGSFPGRVRSMSSSDDGSWAYYAYHNDSTTGRPKSVVYSPFLSTPMPSDDSQAGGIASTLDAFTLSGTANAFPGSRRSFSYEAFPQGHLRRTVTDVYITEAGGTDHLVENGTLQLSQEVANPHRDLQIGANGYQATWSFSERGENGATGFGPVSGSESASLWRLTRITGTNGAISGGTILPGSPSTFSVHDNLSTKEVTISNQFGPILSEMFVRNGGDWFSATETHYTYLADGRPDTVITDGRLVAKYEYPTPGVTVHFSEDGVKTTSARSAEGRLLSTVIETGGATGNTSGSALPVMTTTYVRDGLTSSTLVNGVVQSSTTVDRAGRSKSQTDQIGRTTLMFYGNSSGGGPVTSTFFPGWKYQDSTSHRDGLMVSNLGSAVVPSFYSYSIEEFPDGLNSDGKALATTTYSGPTIGSRFVKTMTDQLGESSASISPNLDGSGTVTTISRSDQQTLIQASQTYVGTVDSTADRAGHVSHPSFAGANPTAAGAMGMSRVSGLHLRGLTAQLQSTDRNYTVSETSYAQLAPSVGGTPRWCQKTTTTRTLTELDESGVTQTKTDQTISWVSLYRGDGDFQQVQANGETLTTTTTYTWGTATRVTTNTSLTGGVSTATFVGGYLTASESSVSDGNATSHTYDSFGREIRTVNARRQITERIYNSVGQLVASKDHDGNTTGYQYFPATHYSAGRLKEVIDPLNRTKVYIYNYLGQVTSLTGSGTYPLAYSYSSEGELVTLTTSNDQGTSVTRWTYHPERRGLLASKTYSHGSTVAETESYKHNAFGQVREISTSNPDTKRRFSFNAFGELSSSSGEVGGQVDEQLIIQNNSYGQPNKMTHDVRHPRLPNGLHKITYYETHHANGTLESDKRDSIDSSQASLYGYTNSDLFPLSSRMSYTMDPLNLARTKSHQLDALLPDWSSFAGIWEALGSTEYAYDNKGRLLSVASTESGSLAQNTPDLTHTYSYHPNSAIPLTITSNDGTNDLFKNTSRVNRLGRTTDVLSHSYAASGGALALRTAVGYQYNAVGQRVRATRENGQSWNYGYNTRGEVTSAKKHQAGSNGGAGASPLGGLQFEYAYDSIGNRTSMKFGGDENGGDLQTVNYGVNANNQYTSISHPGSYYVTGLAGPTGTIEVNNETPVSQGAYFFKKFLENNAPGPLSVSVQLEETPNGGGATTTANVGDIFVPKASVVPQYERGNLINDGRWIYTWNANNRLLRMAPTPEATAAHTAAGHTQVLPTLDFLYDWRGRRISKRVTYEIGGSYPPSILTTFIYDQWNLVGTISKDYRKDGVSTVTRAIWGLDLSGSMQGAGGVGGLLATRGAEYDIYQNASPVVEAEQFPSYDGNGNIIAWTTDNGKIWKTQDYDAFGNIVEGHILEFDDEGDVVVTRGLSWTEMTPFGFSTKYEDEECGLLYYGYRYYDPVTGRWPNRDPIGERGGENIYAFSVNDGLNKIDLLGLDPNQVFDTFQAAYDDAIAYHHKKGAESLKKGWAELEASTGLNQKNAGTFRLPSKFTELRISARKGKGMLFEGLASDDLAIHVIERQGNKPSKWRILVGREKGSSVFCFDNGGTRKYSYNWTEGTVVSKKEAIKNPRVNGRVKATKLVKQKTFKGKKIIKHLNLIHTHHVDGMTFGSFSNGATLKSIGSVAGLSSQDKRWSARTKVPITAVEDNGVAYWVGGGTEGLAKVDKTE